MARRIIGSFIVLLALPSMGGIIGGSPVKKDDPIAATTVMIANTSTGTLCTGSLLANDLIITAYHCIEEDEEKGTTSDPKSIFLHFAMATNISPETAALGRPIQGFRFPIRLERKEAKDGDPEEVDQRDVLLIGFKGGLPDGYHPATLISEDGIIKNEVHATVAGYGALHLDKNGNPEGIGTLRKTRLMVEDTKFGQTEVLLAQNRGRATCYGDSGGPALFAAGENTVLWGIINRGYSKTDDDPGCNQYAVFTRIRSYLDWIKTATEELRKEMQP